MMLSDRIASGEASRELDAEIIFDLFAAPVGNRDDGGPVGYLWPEDNPSWNLGIRFPNSTREDIMHARKRNEGETIIIERDNAIVLMNPLRIPNLTTSLDAAIRLYETIPELIPSDPTKVCIDALRKRGM